MQALESKEFILYIFIKLVSVGMLKFHLLIFSNDWALSGHEVIDLLSIFESTDHSLSLDNFLELIEAYLVNLISFHCLLEESLHLVSLLQ
jgi:hypothetical protein